MRKSIKLAVAGTVTAFALGLGGSAAIASISSSSTSPNKLCYNASGSLRAMHDTCPDKYKTYTGSVGPRGPQGPRGATGLKGESVTETTANMSQACPTAGGVIYILGTRATTICNGAQGPKGDTGPAGQNAQALPYGIGEVLIDRGSGPAVWQTLSTTLGSPVGDTTGGSFRFTCKATDCQVSVKAYTTVTGYQAYPRVLIHKQTADGTMAYCEYADGADNNGSSVPVGTSATDVTMGIGGTLDCGSAQTYPANGVASEITVRASGYYDVDVTWVFSKVS